MATEPHDELIDILDETGVVVDRKMRSEAHTHGLLHQVSSVFLFKDRSEKEVLLAQRAHHLIHNPSKWSISAGGHIKAGSTPLTGARMELSEELFNGKPLPETLELKEVAVYRSNDWPGNHEIVHLFKAYYPGPFEIDREEVEAVKWVDWELLPQLMRERKDEFAAFLYGAYGQLENAGTTC
jgi:isopentenyl-diphosphate delta-isomerase